MCCEMRDVRTDDNGINQLGCATFGNGQFRSDKLNFNLLMHIPFTSPSLSSQGSTVAVEQGWIRRLFSTRWKLGKITRNIVVVRIMVVSQGQLQSWKCRTHLAGRYLRPRPTSKSHLTSSKTSPRCTVHDDVFHRLFGPRERICLIQTVKQLSPGEPSVCECLLTEDDTRASGTLMNAVWQEGR
jgi:hypothetical protein